MDREVRRMQHINGRFAGKRSTHLNDIVRNYRATLLGVAWNELEADPNLRYHGQQIEARVYWQVRTVVHDARLAGLI
jgi:hypothetical protein